MDNYAEFLQRLDTAAKSLKERRDALGRAQGVVSEALEDNDYGYQQWTQRLAQIEKLKGDKATTIHAGLQELHGVAANMQSVFRTRCERIGARLTAVGARIGELDGPLRQLELSKARITASRRVAEEREKLGRAMQDLAGTTEGADAVVPDAGLRDDLKVAREAVAHAEALLELKEG
jgi:DNA repair exonuclease SbcCD ATPase subunit